MKEHKFVNFSQEADVHYIINKYHKKEHEAVKEYLETLKGEKSLTHEDVYKLIEKNLKLKKIAK
ncbi:hypothetical protein [Fusobacterium sp.]|uniref:hypothetical protein n=1 Tax=Fusobacterium sp. TaxID=68766 RepID=UPI002603336D|nr:hypothetical protein [Fusobacterium sp.]